MAESRFREDIVRHNRLAAISHRARSERNHSPEKSIRSNKPTGKRWKKMEKECNQGRSKLSATRPFDAFEEFR